jgi:hypothetical protein
LTTDIEKSSPVPVYQPGENWESLVNSADEILGYDLARDETADDLVGVPLMITRVQFRPGVMRDKEMQAYVTCEARVAPDLDLRLINSRRESSRLTKLTSLDTLAFGPDSHVVFNDGSTGIYRQIVKYLYSRGFIELESPVNEVGQYGESSFDQPPSRWANTTQGYIAFTPEGFATYSADIRLYAPRGLRLSLYQNDYTQTGKTRYLG